MVQITKSIEWDMGHRVPGHAHKCKNPHGHRYRLELTISGLVDARRGSSTEGMIVDFSEVKKVLMETIHDRLDHCFLAYEGDPLAQVMRKECPDLNIFLVSFIPTAENLVLWCYEQLYAAFSQTLNIKQLRLYETPNSWADYIP